MGSRPWASPCRRDRSQALRPDRRVLAAVGDGAFLMKFTGDQRRPSRADPLLTVLIWQDDAVRAHQWKMSLEIGRDVATDFTNPDFVAYAQSFGARGYQVRAAGDLLPISRKHWPRTSSP